VTADAPVSREASRRADAASADAELRARAERIRREQAQQARDRLAAMEGTDETHAAVVEALSRSLTDALLAAMAVPEGEAAPESAAADADPDVDPEAVADLFRD
jgi:glutamyl-tRNA reductase